MAKEQPEPRPMKPGEEYIVKSNVWFGALNVALIVLAYLFVLIAGHLYLRHFHGIDIVYILVTSVSRTSLPFMADILGYLETLFENFVVDSLIAGLVYAAYISNHEIKVSNNEIEFKKGFLLVDKDKFKLEDIEQVYTQGYSFFGQTKQLCIKALDEDVVKIPYVRHADKVKRKLIATVKERNAELELEHSLKGPIKVVSYNPA